MKVSRIVVCLAVVVAVSELRRRRRSNVVSRKRLEWEPHRDRLVQEGQFDRYYRMNVIAFERLVESLKPVLERDQLKSRNRTGIGPVTPVNKVQMTISWLAGGSYHAIRALAGVSTSEFYSAVIEVMNAICDDPRYQITAPVYDMESITRAASQFADISTYNILTGCVGCVDGWLCTIKAPSANEVPDVSAFFSGHYLCYGINVQAMCDAACRFTGYCFNSPGKVSDSVAFKKWPLHTAISNLPFGYYVIGDNAYPLSSSVLVPFTKPEIKTRDYSDYNFYISQLRIRIEMSFGLLVNKWQIFKRPLAVDYVHAGLVIKTCMKLHNYCINERISQPESGGPSNAASREFNAMENCSYLPTVADDTGKDNMQVVNGHIFRKVVLEHIQRYNLARPLSK